MSVRTRTAAGWSSSRVAANLAGGVDVRTLGVTGSGADETTAMQAALNSITTGQTLRIPAGMTVSHAGVLNMTNAGARLVGPGELRGTNPATSALIVKADNITIEGGLLVSVLPEDTVTITGAPTGGTFTLTFQGQTTGAIAFDATAAVVQTALRSLSNIGPGDVTVSGGPGPATSWLATFSGQYALVNTVIMTATSSLTGGTAPTVTVARDRIFGPRNSHAICLDGVDGAILRDVTSMGSGTTGIQIAGVTKSCTNWLLDRVHVKWSRADGIHHADGANIGLTQNCTVEANGDDLISCVSNDNDIGPVHHVVVDNCSGHDNFHGRGFTAVGGHDITYSNFTINNPFAAGVYVATEQVFQTRDGFNISFLSGTITGASAGAAGQPSASLGALHVSNTTSLRSIDLVRFDDITITGTSTSTNREVRYSANPGPVTRVNATNIRITSTTLPPFTTSLPTSGYRNTGWIVNGSGIADVGTYVP